MCVLLQIVSLDELEIRDLDQVTGVYASLLSSHVRLLRILLPRVHWKEVPVLVVFELFVAGRIQRAFLQQMVSG